MKSLLKVVEVILSDFIRIGGEAVNCLTELFKEEKLTDEYLSNRIEYNTIFAKTCQGGNHKFVDEQTPVCVQ